MRSDVISKVEPLAFFDYSVFPEKLGAKRSLEVCQIDSPTCKSPIKQKSRLLSPNSLAKEIAPFRDEPESETGDEADDCEDTKLKGKKQGPWTKEEDEVVVSLVAKFGARRWSFIASHLQGRIGKQCRERWFNHLSPSIKKGPWSEEEDRILRESQQQIGNKWSEIAKLLPGRTENQVKNRWNSTMRKYWQQIYVNDMKTNASPATVAAASASTVVVGSALPIGTPVFVPGPASTPSAPVTSSPLPADDSVTVPTWLLKALVEQNLSSLPYFAVEKLKQIASVSDDLQESISKGLTPAPIAPVPAPLAVVSAPAVPVSPPVSVCEVAAPYFYTYEPCHETPSPVYASSCSEASSPALSESYDSSVSYVSDASSSTPSSSFPFSCSAPSAAPSVDSFFDDLDSYFNMKQDGCDAEDFSSSVSCDDSVFNCFSFSNGENIVFSADQLSF